MREDFRVEFAGVADEREGAARQVAHQRGDLFDLLRLRVLLALDEVFQIAEEAVEVERVLAQALHVESAFGEARAPDEESVEQVEELPRAARHVVEGNVAETPVAFEHPLGDDVVAQEGVAQDDAPARRDLAHLDGVVNVGDDRLAFGFEQAHAPAPRVDAAQRAADFGRHVEPARGVTGRQLERLFNESVGVRVFGEAQLVAARAEAEADFLARVVVGEEVRDALAAADDLLLVQRALFVEDGADEIVGHGLDAARLVHPDAQRDRPAAALAVAVGGVDRDRFVFEDRHAGPPVCRGGTRRSEGGGGGVSRRPINPRRNCGPTCNPTRRVFPA